MKDSEKLIGELRNSSNSSWFIEDKKGNRRFIPPKFANFLLSQHNFKTVMGSGVLYHYSDGLYSEKGGEKLKEFCVKYLQNHYTKNRYSETRSYIEGSTYTPPEAINNGWINLENGLLNPVSGEFIEHTPDIFTVSRVPIKYDPDAECPEWESKLQEKLDPETIITLQEMFGYCYLPGQRFQAAFLMHGPQRSMKSTSLGILGEMLGESNITAFSLQALTVDKFTSAYLYGRLANICPDIDSSALKNTGTFMTITGGDAISPSKKHGHPFTFRPNSKLIFSCNVVPPTYNKDKAFYRRWIILPFRKVTLAGDVDPMLRDRLRGELPGILNWSLRGLRRILENGEFSHRMGEDEVKDFYERHSDSIQSFIFNTIDTEDDDGNITKREVYKAYSNYCNREGLRIENQIRFGKNFIALTGCGTCKNKKGIPSYQGVSFKEHSKQGGLNGYLDR